VVDISKIPPLDWQFPIVTKDGTPSPQFIRLWQEMFFNDNRINSGLDEKVTGPGSSTDNAVARFDGITGKLLQDSLATLDDLGNLSVTDLAYDATTWNGSLVVPTRNAVRDKIEDILDGQTFTGDVIVPDEAYDATGWNGDLSVPTKNAVRDKIEALGVVAYASISETSTGTETAKAVTPDGLAGSIFGTAVITLLVTDPNGSAITTGDGKAYWRVPSVLNGMNLVAVAAHVTTVSSSGLPTVQIANVTQAVDMLTTKITIDASEKDSSTAATAAVIDTANDDVATGDEIRIDIDVAGTGAKGLIVEMQFQLP